MQREPFVAVHPRFVRVRRAITIANVRFSLGGLLTVIGAVVWWGVQVSGGADPQMALLLAGGVAVLGIAAFDIVVARRSLPTLARSALRYALRRRAWRVQR